MATQKYFDLDTFKRYFHLITFKSDKKYSAINFLQDIGATIKETSQFSIDFSFTIYQSEIISNVPYYNGDKDYSLNKDGQPPYKYDLFAVHMFSMNMFVIAFPFKHLAKTSLNNLIETKKIMSKGSFVKCDINKLLIENSENDLSDENFTSYFSGLDLTLTGDEKLSSVNLDGDKPLQSNLYKQVFSKIVDSRKCHLERCSLQCRLINQVENIPKAKANIHVDLFGNYKMYVHGSGKNIFTIPYLFTLLSFKECLKLTLSNPIDRLQDE